MSTLRLIASAAFGTGVYGVLLFGPAWTLNWPRAWILLGLVFAGMIVTRVWALRDRSDLLAERRKPPIQAGQPRADKWLVAAFLVIFPAYIASVPIDVFHEHVFERPAMLISALGLIGAFFGWLLVSLAFRENAFAVAIVTDQGERGQTVIKSGIYGIVRHPLYAGVILILIGFALWLQSYAAVLCSIVPIAVVILRIIVEEHFLTQRLPEYKAYARRVPYRLIPCIW